METVKRGGYQVTPEAPVWKGKEIHACGGAKELGYSRAFVKKE